MKVIVNNRNFGHIRSCYHAMLQARGQAVIAMASDLEDPPEMIPQFVRKWEEGYKIVLAQEALQRGAPLMSAIRQAVLPPCIAPFRNRLWSRTLPDLAFTTAG